MVLEQVQELELVVQVLVLELEELEELEQGELVQAQEQALEDQALLLRHQALDLQDSVCDNITDAMLRIKN